MFSADPKEEDIGKLAAHLHAAGQAVELLKTEAGVPGDQIVLGRHAVRLGLISLIVVRKI